MAKLTFDIVHMKIMGIFIWFIALFSVFLQFKNLKLSSASKSQARNALSIPNFVTLSGKN